MRSDNYVIVEAEQVALFVYLVFNYIDAGAFDPFIVKRLYESLFIYYRSARRVNEKCGRLHHLQFSFADQMIGNIFYERTVKGYDIRLLKEFVERLSLAAAEFCQIFFCLRRRIDNYGHAERVQYGNHLLRYLSEEYKTRRFSCKTRCRISEKRIPAAGPH